MVKAALSKSVKARDSDSRIVGSTPTTSTCYVAGLPAFAILFVCGVQNHKLAVTYLRFRTNRNYEL